MAKKKSIINVKTIAYAVITLVIAAFLIMLVPLNSFTHGFYFNKFTRASIPESDWYEPVSLEEPYMVTCNPNKNFAGVAVYFAENNATSGSITLTIDTGSEVIDTITVDSNDIPDGDWYIFESSAKYKDDVAYRITIDASSCDKAPSLQSVSENYTDKEIFRNDCTALITLGYAHDTFQSYEKSLITLFLLTVLLFLAGEFFLNGKKQSITRTVSVFFAVTTVFNWVFMFNSIDDENTSFVGFQYDSEILVLDGFNALDNGVSLSPYGLGTYNSFWTYVTDDNWYESYNRTSPTILIAKNEGTQNLAKVGNVVHFERGQQYRIIDVIDYGDRYGITLDSPEVFSARTHGALSGITFYSEDGTRLAPGVYEGYISSLGLQGKVFRRIAGNWNSSVREQNLRMVTSFLTALVLSGIVLLINRRYNFLMALCFGITFLLSPWIVNYGNSLYWVEVTWFMPMLIGLICSIWIDNKWVRIASYVMAFISIMIKSLCGYEFITAVMLGLITFVLVDLLDAIIKKDKKKAFLVFRTTVILGIAALLGFFMAIVLHANLRGDGSIAEGISSIIERDVLRRVGGGGLNDFEELYWDSFNASTYETFSKYFHFKTDVIAGIDPNMFTPLVILPVVILVYDYFHKKLNTTNALLYVVTFLSSISWFVLAKNHSYIHTHMNFVMWYFGFVQICLYIIADKIYRFTSSRKEADLK